MPLNSFSEKLSKTLIKKMLTISKNIKLLEYRIDSKIIQCMCELTIQKFALSSTLWTFLVR